MPIYRYRCAQCDHVFEDLVKMGTPDSDVSCPSCGERDSRRTLAVFSTPKAQGLAPCGQAEGACSGARGFG